MVVVKIFENIKDFMLKIIDVYIEHPEGESPIDLDESFGITLLGKLVRFYPFMKITGFDEKEYNFAIIMFKKLSVTGYKLTLGYINKEGKAYLRYSKEETLFPIYETYLDEMYAILISDMGELKTYMRLITNLLHELHEMYNEHITYSRIRENEIRFQLSAKLHERYRLYRNGFKAILKDEIPVLYYKEYPILSGYDETLNSLFNADGKFQRIKFIDMLRKNERIPTSILSEIIRMDSKKLKIVMAQFKIFTEGFKREYREALKEQLPILRKELENEYRQILGDYREHIASKTTEELIFASILEEYGGE